MPFDWINNDDLNGECFIAGEIGEVEEMQEHRIVYFGPDTPAAQSPGVAVVFNSVQMTDFLILNAHLHAQTRQDDKSIKKVDILVSYVRFLAARNGLVSPAFDKSAHHVKYNEAVRLSQKSYEKISNIPKQSEFPDALWNAEERKKLRVNFANIVCCIAYMFRVRGHHYLPEMDAKYQGLWKKCIKGEAYPVLEWQYLAHDALHAIMPDVLDNFWTNMIENGNIAGALEKRYNSAPAGVAAVRAVYTGAQDLQMAVPGIRQLYKGTFEDLDQIVDMMKKNRWAGSINRKYYDAPKVDFDEQKFGAVAAVIYSALTTFAANSPLLQSKALERVANNAPITGGVVSRSIASAATNPKVAERLFLVSDQ